MADTIGSSNGAGGSGGSTPKAIASLAKKQADVTRLGTQKLKFVPTLPARRKKDEVKVEEAPAASTSERGRGRGRGGDRGRGRGRGGEARGGARPPVEMVASGPFAMGPALAGQSGRRTAPRSNFTPAAPGGPGGSSKLGAGLTKSAAPSLGVKREGGQENHLGRDAEERRKVDSDEEEVYSEPDEGVEIIDMDNVQTMDWMAPEILKKDKIVNKKKKAKKEDPAEDLKGKGVDKLDPMQVDDSPPPKEEVNLANAVDLSDSEEEEVLEDIANDFSVPVDEDDMDVRAERLYFFQFPEPFPTFVSQSSAAKDDKGKGVAADTAEEASVKKVTFADDTKPPASGATTPSEDPQVKKEGSDDEPKLSGIVGQLEVYQSGAVKLRLGNGVLLDVTSATQPSFLQHAVYMDTEHKRMCILGEVNRRFVVSPDIQTLLESMEIAEQQPAPTVLEDAGLIRMDTS